MAAALEITEDALATDWTLSEADIATVFDCCRGTEHCLRFAIQLCTLRNTGRFLPDYRPVPLKVANYLSQQLETDPVLFVPEPLREATEYRHQEQIRGYLGYRSFGETEEQLFEVISCYYSGRGNGQSYHDYRSGPSFIRPNVTRGPACHDLA